MFSKTKTATKTAVDSGNRKGPASTVPSILGADMVVTGDVTQGQELQIDGTVVGNVTASIVRVGETGRVTGRIVSERVVVDGTIEGTIEGKSVAISKTAKIVGDVFHETLAVEPGAHLEGHCRRIQETDVAALKKEPAVMAGVNPIDAVPSNGQSALPAKTGNGAAVEAGVSTQA